MAHFDRVQSKDDVSAYWVLWLAYDIEVCHCTCVSNLDPTKFHYTLWNNLKPNFIARPVESALLGQLHPIVPASQSYHLPWTKREGSIGLDLPWSKHRHKLEDTSF